MANAECIDVERELRKIMDQLGDIEDQIVKLGAHLKDDARHEHLSKAWFIIEGALLDELMSALER